MMTKRKKGQMMPGPASMASVLVLMIGFAIILYILMLPPADREYLLNNVGDNAYNGSSGEKYDNITILLAKEPGTLNYLAKNEEEFDIPSFNLFTRTDAQVLLDFDSIYIRKSLFNYEFANITFDLDSTDNLDNFLFSYSAPIRKGILRITLNGRELYKGELRNENPEPLRLQKEFLQKENILTFEVSGPGMNFWEANEYNLENIKITADYTDYSGQESRQIFLVSDQVKKFLEEGVELSFTSDCNLAQVGPLTIYLNNYPIFEGIPDCGNRMKLPQISRDRILAGENTLRFRTEKGNYLFYSMKLRLNLEEPIYPTYYFTLSPEMAKNLEDDIAQLNVTLVFSNFEDYKKGEIWLNGYITEIETREGDYTRNLADFARENNNAIEIRPKSEKLDVVEMKVIYAE